jgi:hypothetical protein
MGLEEGEKVQNKSRETIFNKILAENFPDLEKDIVIKV